MVNKRISWSKIMTYVLEMVCSMLKNDYSIQEVCPYPFMDNIPSQKLL